MRQTFLLSIIFMLFCNSMNAQTLLKTGDKAPLFSAPNQNGKVISLSEYTGHKVILYFYPKDNTRGCTTEACNIRDNYDSLLAKGYVILGVSRDDALSHQNFIKLYNLPFDLLVDSDATINKAYGVWAQKEKDGEVFYGTTRKTFIIDERGIISKIIDNVQVDSHSAQILAE